MAASTPEAPPARSSTPHLDPLTQSLAYLQPWIDHVPKPQRRLGLFIFLALLVHLATFFFIRIDTTRAEMSHQALTHVTVQSAAAGLALPSDATDGFWDQLTDPRLFLLPLRPFSTPSPTDPPIDFSAINPRLASDQLPAAAPVRDRPEARQAVLPVDQKVATTMQPTRQPFTYDETPAAVATQTAWEWDPALAARQPAAPATPLSSPVSDTDLIPTQLRLAVNAEGAVEHVLVEQSCGKIELDQQAVLAALKLRFLPADGAPLLWGRLSIAWNYTVPAREVVVPTPPSST